MSHLNGVWPSGSEIPDWRDFGRLLRHLLSVALCGHWEAHE
jgi:hypothetical protein